MSDTDAEAKEAAVNFLLAADLATEDKLIAIRKIPELGTSPGALLQRLAKKQGSQSSFTAEHEYDIPYTKVLQTKAALDACVNLVQP